MRYPLVLDLAAEGIPVAVTCRVLKFSTQAFYAWKAAPVTARDWHDAHLINAARDIHHDDPTFGYRFIHDELPAHGIRAGAARVARLCSQERIWSVHAKKRGFSIFMRSLDGRPGVVGRDVAVMPQLAAALDVVDQRGGVAVSEPFLLFKDRDLPADQRQLSLVLAAAVTDPQGRPRGWVIMDLRGRDLIASTLRQTGQDALNASLTTSALNTDSTGGTGAAPGSRQGSQPGNRQDAAVGGTVSLVRYVSGSAHDPRLVRRASVAVGQRTWTLTMQGTDTAKARDTRGGDLSRTVLGGGALITILLTGLVYLLSTSRSRALRAADVATGELRQANERFRFAFDHAHTGMAVVDVHPERLGRFIQVNDALCDMLGRSSEDLTRRSLLELTHPDEKARIADHWRHSATAARAPSGWRSATCTSADASSGR